MSQRVLVTYYIRPQIGTAFKFLTTSSGTIHGTRRLEILNWGVRAINPIDTGYRSNRESWMVRRFWRLGRRQPSFVGRDNEWFIGCRFRRKQTNRCLNGIWSVWVAENYYELKSGKNRRLGLTGVPSSLKVHIDIRRMMKTLYAPHSLTKFWNVAVLRLPLLTQGT